MAKIMIADDARFWRDVAATALRGKGHSVFTANDGLEALTLLQKESAELVILDVEMPKLEGLGFLEHIRKYPEWKELPVIMLTGDMNKEQILRARGLGAVDYLIKTGFSLTELTERVQKRLTKPKPVAVAAESTAPAVPPAAGGAMERLLSREQSIGRARGALEGRTLSGLVMQIITTATSPRLELVELAQMIGHDATLAARVLQSANSVAYASNRGVITNLEDAVRVVGSATIRDIATSLGVFEAMPPTDPDGFDPIRCWQHSIAVGVLCARLAPESLRGVAYLVGLCHDVGEILFRNHFGAEYRQVLETAKNLSKPRQEVERQMLGITRGEVAQIILEQLGLPLEIQRPIADFHAGVESGKRLADPGARLLQLADSYSTGLLLGTSDYDTVRPVTRAECRAVIGQTDPATIPAAEFRSDIYVLTAQYARLSPRDQAKICQPPHPASAAPIWIMRDSAFSDFDPLAAAVGSLASPIVETRFPTAAEIADCKGLIVVGRSTTAAGMSVADLAKSIAPARVQDVPILWLNGPGDEAAPGASQGILFRKWPISTRDLKHFIAYGQVEQG